MRRRSARAVGRGGQGDEDGQHRRLVRALRDGRAGGSIRRHEHAAVRVRRMRRRRGMRVRFVGGRRAWAPVHGPGLEDKVAQEGSFPGHGRQRSIRGRDDQITRPVRRWAGALGWMLGGAWSIGAAGRGGDARPCAVGAADPRAAAAAARQQR
jgi:hypothetical protein